MRQRVDLALVAAVYCVALLARSIPLFASTLPFTPDGFPLAKIATQIAASGQWTINPADPNLEDLKVPGISLMISALAQIASLNPLLHTQAVLPVLTATTVVPVFLIGVKWTGRRAAGLAAALFLAIYGGFLFPTIAVMKETLGLVLLPATVLMVYERADPRKRGIAVVLLLLLIFVDYLTLFMAMGIAVSLVLLSIAGDTSRRHLTARRLFLDLAMIGAPLTVAWEYYNSVKLFYFTEVTSTSALLVLAAIGIVVVVVLLLRRKSIESSVRRGFVLPLAIFCLGVLGIVALMLESSLYVFLEAPKIQPELLTIAPAIVFLAILAAFGFLIVRRAALDLNDLVVSMLATPFLLITFGIAINRPRLSFRIAYRSIDFVDFGFAILAGFGLAVAIGRFGFRRPAGIAVGAAFLVALLVTTPIAYDTTAVFRVQTAVTPQEFQSLQLIVSLGANSVVSDMRLSTVALWWFGLRSDFRLPLWLQDHTPIFGIDYALVLERWATVGATMFPEPNVVVDRGILDAFLSSNRVIYVFGLPGDRTFVVRLLHA